MTSLAATPAIAERVRTRIAEIVGPQKYKIWFKNSTQFTYGDGFLKVGVPNLFIGNWIEHHFADAIHQAAAEVIDGGAKVSFAIDPELFRNMRKSQLNSQAAYIEKSSERMAREAKAPVNGHAATWRPAVPAPRKLRYKLGDYVVGPSNRLAYSAALGVVESTSSELGVVCFFGGCGLGKTHLLQGIANALADRQPATRWEYVSGEEFTNQFLVGLRDKKLDAFRHRYRDVDVLLIDDFQFIANKRATQEEFFHTFNAISANNKRIVLASDAHPKMIGDLTESLVSRILAGMVVKIDRPDVATRREILRRMAARTHRAIAEPVIDYMAGKIEGNVRELEGCLIKLVACASLRNTDITLDIAREALDEHLRQTGKIISVSDIEMSVATYFGLCPADLHSSRKSRTIALARNVAMLLARRHTDLSFPEIGRLMGNKNHTTVLLACRRIDKHLSDDAVVTWQGAAGPVSRKIREIVAGQEGQLAVAGLPPARP